MYVLLVGHSVACIHEDIWSVSSVPQFQVVGIECDVIDNR